MDIPETDSEDELPPGWDERCTLDGHVFYTERENFTTRWKHPRTGKRKRVPKELPFGWLREEDKHGHVVYTNAHTNKRTYVDPRLAYAVELTETPTEFRQRFDSETKGLQITHGVDLTDTIAIVTGANSGIGYETARSLLFRGCRVIFACRDVFKAQKCMQRLKTERSYVKCEAIPIDLKSLKSVKIFVESFKRKFGRCDILILNAGVFGLSRSFTRDGVESTIQVNFLSQLYLSILIQPFMVSSKLSRMVFVSSESHRFADAKLFENFDSILYPSSESFSSMTSFNVSKLCVVFAAFEMHRRFGYTGLKCYAVHPGNLVFTNHYREWWLYRLICWIVRPFTKNTEQACSSTVYCAVTEDVANLPGLYVNNSSPCEPSQEALDPILSNRVWNKSLDLIEAILGKTAFVLDHVNPFTAETRVTQS